MASGPITSWEIDEETVDTVTDFIFGAPKSLQMVTATMKLKDAYSLKGKSSLDQHIKKQRHYFANKGPSCQCCSFSSSQDAVLLLPRAWVPPGSAAKILQTSTQKVDIYSFYVFLGSDLPASSCSELLDIEGPRLTFVSIFWPRGSWKQFTGYCTIYMV